jgi:DNA-binding transcriptional ArsR family regulator
MEDLQQILGALNSPVRRRILAMIWDRERPASEIAAAFNVTAPTVSQHLAVLRGAGLATVRAQGNFRLYRARQDVLRGFHGAWPDRGLKWTPADDVPERSLAHAETHRMVVAQVDVDTDQVTTFRAFTDPAVYSNWMGVPVTIEDGRFTCTLEWGTQVEGLYELVVPPRLIVLRWNFEDGNVPIPGGEMVGYMRFAPLEEGCHVEVHQLLDAGEHAEFMEAAWTLVLGRLRAGVVAASAARVALPARAPRSKRRHSA